MPRLGNDTSRSSPGRAALCPGQGRAVVATVLGLPGATCGLKARILSCTHLPRVHINFLVTAHRL